MTATDQHWQRSQRLSGLRRFAVAITAFNLLGHTLFGFEQSWAQPLVALAAAYGTELLLELIDAWARRRPLRFRGGPGALVDFLLSAHITGLAVAMLIYANDRLWPIVFGTVVAVASKAIFRVPAGRGTRHFFNPSNLGITVTLLCFPWVGIAPPYMFTENLDRVGDWLLPGLIVISGTALNARYTRRLPLIAAWLGAFALQAVARHLVWGTSLTAAWLPMTGVAFVLYTFYMVTDPATTPNGARAQVAFGAGTAVAYGALMAGHVVFGLFFGLTLVCGVRGLGLAVQAWAGRRRPVPAPAPLPVEVPEGGAWPAAAGRWKS